jgi:hypothetical protein
MLDLNEQFSETVGAIVSINDHLDQISTGMKIDLLLYFGSLVIDSDNSCREGNELA